MVDEFIPEQSPIITRLTMPKDDELFFILKYGMPPPFRLERIHQSNGPNEKSDEKHYVEYYLTNYPKADDEAQ